MDSSILILYVLVSCFHNPNFCFVVQIPLVHIIKFSFNFYWFMFKDLSYSSSSKLLTTTKLLTIITWTTLSELKVPWKFPGIFKVPSFLCLCVYAFFFNFIEWRFLISLKLRSMLNLTLRLQTLHTFLSSKLWHHLLIIELYRSNFSHEFIHCIADLKEPLYICHFHWESHIFLTLIENVYITNPSFIIWGMQLHAHTFAHT